MISIPKTLALGAAKTAKSIKELVTGLINYQSPKTLQDGATITWDLNRGYNTKVTLAGDRTLVLQGLTRGDYGTIEIIQDSTGSRLLTLPSNSVVMGTQGTADITLSTDANAIDIATFYFNGETLYWTVSLY